MENGMAILQTLKIELPYNPEIPLLGFKRLKKLGLEENCTPMFTVTLFITAQRWKQPKCLLMAEWIHKCG